jgi:2-amino-4-hydroxy-6-hydroxymethyldihydropteridine diphosphokinase
MASHPLLATAAEGDLPDWAMAGQERREHMARVADLLDAWAHALKLDEDERLRWRAAAHLHDALRDAPPATLAPLVGEELAGLPEALLHGPAAAERLREEGVEDEELLAAVAFHTTGHPDFGRLGRALYAADFLEPGRAFLTERRAQLRARAPAGLDAIVREVARARIAHLVERGLPVDPRTEAFWNTLVAASRG